MYIKKIVVQLFIFILLLFCTLNAFAQYEQKNVIDFLTKVCDRHDENLHTFLISELQHFLKTFQGGNYSDLALSHLGKIYEEKGDITEAMASYVKVLFLYPQSPYKSEWAQLIWSAVTNKKFLSGHNNEVIKIDKNRSLKDGYYDYLFFLINLDQPSLGKWLLSSCREYLQLFPEDKKNDQVLFWIANIYEKMGKQKEADASYLKLEMLYPESKLLARSLFRRSKILCSKFKQYEEAVVLLDRIVTKYPESKIAANALFQMATIKEKRQKAYTQAIADYYNLVKNYPEDKKVIQALFTIARINYKKLKNYSETISAYNEIVNRDTTQLDGLIALEKIASIYKNKLKDLEKTVDTLERIADLNTNYETAAKKLYLAASICEKKLKDDKRAVYYYQLVLDKSPNHKKALDIGVKIQEIQNRLAANNSFNINEHKTASLISEVE